MLEKPIDIIEKQPNSLEKKAFWHYARKHLEEMKLLFRGGRLSKKEDSWNNDVIDHCLVQGAEVDALAHILGLKEVEKEKLQKTAFIHDWDKRLELKPGDFTEEQRAEAEELLKRVSPDLEILESTAKGFSKKIIDGQASFLQKLMFYIDDITSRNEIVGYQERIDEVEARTNLNEDAELTKKLEGRFWDVERQACRQVEEELFVLLKKRGIEINLPQDIPQLIKNEVTKEIHFAEKKPEKEKTKFSIEILAEAQAESKEGRRNEDTFVAVENDSVLVAAVLDGATELSTITGISSSNEQGGRFAAQNAALGIEKNYKNSESAVELLLAGNRQIAESLLYRGINPDKSSPENLPNTQATLALIKKKEGVVEIAQTGDAVCLIEYRDGRIEIALPLDITPQDIEALRQGQKISREKNIGLKEAFTSEIINKLMIEGRKLCNKKDKTGVGVLDGQQSAQLYIKTKRYQLADVAKIMLLTDGLFLPTEEIGAEPDWVKMARIIDEKGTKGLYQEVLAIKNSDPEFNKFPRFKKHDDATSVVIRLPK